MSPVTIPNQTDLSTDDLDRWAKERAGLLGTHPKATVELLEAHCGNRWKIEWIPDPRKPEIGRIKLRPITDQAVNLLDHGRASVLRRRHTWMPHEVALSFTRSIKRHSKSNNFRVQDFLIHYWRVEGVVEAMRSKADFFLWAERQAPRKLKRSELEAVFELMPHVRKTLNHCNRRRKTD